MATNHDKDISTINTPIRFHLPDGSTQSFSNAEEAQAWFDQNYADDYSITDYTPTEDSSTKPVQLSEVTITANAPQKTSSLDDDIRRAIFEGNYRGRRFTPTLSNIQHYLDLYESDKHIAEQYGGKVAFYINNNQQF